MIKAGVIGAAGYTGGELIRLLLLHPETALSFAQSESQNGKFIYEIHKDLFGQTDLKFSDPQDLQADVIFLCKGHGESRKFLEKALIPYQTKIIDLSQDFRWQEHSSFQNRKFIYGLSELNKEKLNFADSVANPGCFATAIELALLPLAKKGLLQSSIHVSATTGSTGAGQSLSESTHFSWRSNNHSSYKELDHQHEKEIMETIAPFQGELDFIPQRGAFTRGIHATIYTEINEDLMQLNSIYTSYYNDSPFVHLTPFVPDVKMVVNTNNCFLHLTKKKNKVIITSVIDNLMKGAAGQAIQNMNLLFGKNEKTGLTLKPSTF